MHLKLETDQIIFNVAVKWIIIAVMFWPRTACTCMYLLSDVPFSSSLFIDQDELADAVNVS